MMLTRCQEQVRYRLNSGPMQFKNFSHLNYIFSKLVYFLAEVEEAKNNDIVEMESTDNVDLDEESTSQEVDSHDEKDALVEGVTTSMPPTTVVTKVEMKDETVETRDGDMEMTTVMGNVSEETTSMMSSEKS